MRTLRMSNTVLGNGYVEVLTDEEIFSVRDKQRHWGMEGFAVVVPVPVEAKKTGDNTIEATFVERIGRFGWKCQEASLLNFSAGAYVTEMGVTSPMQPKELKPNGQDVSMYDKVADPEDKFIGDKDPTKTDHLFGFDVESFTRFMRSTKASPRDPEHVDTPDVIEGEKLFRNNHALGCAVCHRPDFTTPKAGTKILTLEREAWERHGHRARRARRQGDPPLQRLPAARCRDRRRDRPDPACQPAREGPESASEDSRRERTKEGSGVSTAAPRRTIGGPSSRPPSGASRSADRQQGADGAAVGARSRPQLMHDGLSLTIDDAIRRHGGQAEGVRLKYEALSSDQKRQLLAFLSSL